MYEITTSQIPYDADDLKMVGHLAQPLGKGPWPAVLIGHDGVGLDDYQKGRADDLAGRGYVALAMDYHGGETFFGNPEAMLARTLPLLADAERMQAIGLTALNILLATPGVDAQCIAALGIGAGGLFVLELVQTGVPFEAVALIHPALPQPGAYNCGGVAGAFLLMTGSEDPLCTPEQLLAFGRVLQASGIDWRANVLGGAKHAFWAQPTNTDGSPSGGTDHVEATVPGVGYHPENAKRAWQGVLDLFAERLPAPGAR
ncbi:MAG: dienelactone hydrolase family protein [Sphingomonas sp.]